jgi:predicted acyl esterase
MKAMAIHKSTTIEVSSSNFPKFSRNSNTGQAVFDEKACDYQKATNTIYHGGNKLSRLLLPILK